MALFKLDEKVNDRYKKLLGEDTKKQKPIQSSFYIESKITPWLEDLDWVFLNDLKEDYEGVKLNENVIHFLFSDDFARHKALNIIENRFSDFNIKPKFNN